LREDQGEIDAATGGKLPELIAVEDIRGDLHVHTAATDGSASLREMALAAQAELDFPHFSSAWRSGNNPKDILVGDEA
jgi:hypothetical protein